MLLTLKEILSDAKKNGYAVGAFNIANLEAVIAVLGAATELNQPVIIQYAQGHEKFMPFDIIGPIMLDMAKKAKIPVSVHLDHCDDFNLAMRALRLGFTSVMIDKSLKPYEENIAASCEIVKIAHAMGVSVEAELGHMTSSSNDNAETESADSMYTDPKLAKDFVSKTNVDALAISFGTIHGIYKKKPVLDFSRITAVKNETDIPLVMHGGSGVGAEGFREAIKCGISKVNYYTYMDKAGGTGVREMVKTKPESDILYMREVVASAIAAMKEDVKEAITAFSMK